MLRHQRPAELRERAARLVPADGGVVYERSGRHSCYAAGVEAGSTAGGAGSDLPARGRFFFFNLHCKASVVRKKTWPGADCCLNFSLHVGAQSSSGDEV